MAENLEKKLLSELSKQDLAGLNLACAHCGKSKAQSEFYRRTPTRLDPTCIECRRKERKEKYQRQINKNGDARSTAKRIIEPKLAIPPIESKIFETNQIANNCEFDDIENVYGKLSCNERHEVVHRFNEFVSLLIEGYGEILGCNVYVRKD